MALIDTIKTAIVDREEELRQKFQKEHIVEREASSSIKLSTDVALVIAGVRRCGKSILAYMLAQHHRSAYVNFEDERLVLDARELNTVLEAIYALKGEVDLIILDEIQNIAGWERFVARLLPTKKIVITGSNARLLSKELSTFLTGRHINIQLFPFSFREFCAWKKFTPSYQTKDLAQVKMHLQEYMEKGAFPLTYKLGNTFLLETYRDILERDVVQRYNIKHVKALKDISKYLISHCGKEFSYNQLKNIFAVKSVHTVKNYISYLHNAYLLFLVERFSFKLKEQALAPRKVYCIDTGLINTVGFSISSDWGMIMENVVAVELWRRGKEMYYWKDHQQHEVDFILKEGKKIVQLIQVCADVSHISTKEREIRALRIASRELRCTKSLIITDDYDAVEKHEGLAVQYIPLWKWALEHGGSNSLTK